MIPRYYGSFFERRLSKLSVKNFANASTKTKSKSDVKTDKNIAERWYNITTILQTRGFIDEPVFSYSNKYKPGSSEWHAELELKFKYNSQCIKTASSGSHSKKDQARQEAIDKMIDLLENEYKLSDLKLEKIKCRKPQLNPKDAVMTFYSFKRRLSAPEILYEEVWAKSNNDHYWKGTLNIDWPFEYHFVETGQSKGEIRSKIFQRLADEFKKAGIFDEFYNFSKVNKAEIFNQPGVVDRLSLNFDQEIESKIVKLKESCDELEKLIKSSEKSAIHDQLKNDNEIETSIDNGLEDEPCVVSSGEIIDIITGLPLRRLTEDQGKLDRRNGILLSRWSKMNDNSANEYVKSMLRNRTNLPIYSKKHEILDLIDKNKVIVLKGETGCGKTTQLPQYILENFIEKNEGSRANIIVTQPRRLSAVSVAQRIADERFERLGGTVGYRIRLDNKKPMGNGSIYFTTPGMLLRSRLNNMDFEGISHIIIDEVHERDMWTDFLLICLKRALKSNPDLKLILMSATIATEKFQKYFDDCPLVEISGQTFPVVEHYLDNLEILLAKKIDLPPAPQNLNLDSNGGRSKIATDLKTVVDMLRYIHKSHEPGAILCFLPTSGDIRKVQESLEADQDPSLLILPCHSRLSVNDQQKVFDRPPQNQRKLVLATNIAETSVTIDDVKYVVNTGTCKSEILDDKSKVLRAVEMWSSQAAQKQRKGRAGRVSRGLCYHLFPKDFMARFDEHSHPELRTKPLTNLILFAKLYCPDEDPAKFLSEAIEPPHDFQINTAVDELIDLNFLGDDRRLTPLGRRLAGLGCSPYLAKAMYYAIFLKCSDPVLSIVSMLELNNDVFVNSPDIDRSLINRAKLDQMDSTISDHLLLAKIFEKYNQCMKNHDSPPKITDTENSDVVDSSGQESNFLTDFCQKNYLDAQSLALASNLKSLFSKQLQSAGIVDKNDQISLGDSDFNENQRHPEIITAALAAGFGKNVLKLSVDNILVQNCKSLKSNNLILLDCSNRRNMQFRAGCLDLLKQSLNCREKSKYENDHPSSNSNLPGKEHDVFWFNTFERVLSVDGRTFRLEDLGLVNPLLVLLFSGFGLEPYGNSNIILQPSKDFRLQLGSAAERDHIILLRQILHQLIDFTCRVGFKADKSIVGTTEEASVAKLDDARESFLKILNDLLSSR